LVFLSAKACTRSGTDRKGKSRSQKAAEGIREEQRKWRLSLPMERYADMRKKFNKAGITVYIAKFAPSAWSDEEIDYAYNAAKVLGSIGITDELTDAACQRLGKFAEKHNSLAMFHTMARWPIRVSHSISISLTHRQICLNLDAGHYFGATGLHPNDVIVKYHDRMRSIHIKDKTGPNMQLPIQTSLSVKVRPDSRCLVTAQKGKMADKCRS